MDDISLKKGKGDYVVILVDLDTHEVIDLLESRTKEFLINYFTNKGKTFCEQILVFCSDMWTAYLEIAKEIFVNATIVVDRFHTALVVGSPYDLKYLKRLACSINHSLNTRSIAQ